MTDGGNPLLEGLQLRRRPEPCAVVIFGVQHFEFLEQKVREDVEERDTP